MQSRHAAGAVGAAARTASAAESAPAAGSVAATRGTRGTAAHDHPPAAARITAAYSASSSSSLSAAGTSSAAGQQPERLPVALPELIPHRVGNRRRLAVAQVAALHQPHAQELLVQLALRLAPGEPVGVAVGKPVAAAVRRVHLVGQQQFVADGAEFILGVHQDQAAAGGQLDAAPVQPQRRRLDAFPQRAGHDAAGEQLVARQRAIVLSGGCLGLRSQQRLGKRLVGAHPRGQPDAGHRPLELVVTPRRAGQVAAHHHLHRHHRAAPHQHAARRHLAQQVVGHDVGGVPEPEHRQLIQHLPLAGNGGQDTVECRHPIAGHQQQAVVEIHHLAHLERAHLRQPAGTRQERVQPVAPQPGECPPTVHPGS